MKKSLAIIISALFVLTIFTACVANKADDTITPNPPTASSTKNGATESTEEMKNTLLQETTTQEETYTAVPRSTVSETASSETKAQETQKAVQSNNTTKKAETAKTVSTTIKEFNISRDEAKEIALSHAGLKDTDISYYKSELDRERKSIVYEIEFDSGKYEYEYEIDADTGKIVKAEKEIRD